MNPNFIKLPEEKQLLIINAGFKVFSQNTYKKAPMLEIAEEAGISKSLLFYHFKNKKELYLYLWEVCIAITREQLENSKVLETNNLFEMMRRSLRSKCEIMRRYPYMTQFSLQAYYEQNEEVHELIQKDFMKQADVSLEKVLTQVDRSDIREDLDIAMIYKEMVLASDGYMHMTYAGETPSPDRIEQEYEQMIAFWQKAYGKKSM